VLPSAWTGQAERAQSEVLNTYEEIAVFGNGGQKTRQK
jgi:hypothetical protein